MEVNKTAGNTHYQDHEKAHANKHTATLQEKMLVSVAAMGTISSLALGLYLFSNYSLTPLDHERIKHVQSGDMAALAKYDFTRVSEKNLDMWSNLPPELSNYVGAKLLLTNPYGFSIFAVGAISVITHFVSGIRRYCHCC